MVSAMALSKKTGGGSRKGIPNKATKDIRAVFSAFVEHNAERAQKLFDQFAEKDPAKALDLPHRRTQAGIEAHWSWSSYPGAG